MEQKEKEEVWEELPDELKESAVKWWLGTRKALLKKKNEISKEKLREV